jgi:hypothetical protein
MTAQDAANADLVEAVQDGLNMRGFSVYEPATEKRFLKIINSRGALADVLIARDGTVTWEYHPFAGSPHGPAITTAIVLAILDAPASPAARPSVAHEPGPTLKELLDRAAAEYGLRTAPFVYKGDETSPDNTYTETCIANPARPERGEVLAGDDGAIWWTCRLCDPAADEHGLEPADIAGTISRVLAMPRTDTAPPAAA